MTDTTTVTTTATARADRRLRWALAALVVVGLAMRLVDLGDRALHHDESLDAWFSLRFLNGDYEGYDPVYHGPLRFYVTAGFYWLFGTTTATARLLSALAGTALIAMPYALRRQLGPAGTLATAAILAVSPSFLYFSRFGREDAFFVALTLAFAVVLLRYLDRPGPWAPTALVGLLVAMVAVKESAFIVVFVVGSFLLVELAHELWVASGRRSLGVAPHLLALAALVVAFWLGEPIFLNLGWFGALVGMAVVGAGLLAHSSGARPADVPLWRAVGSWGGGPWAVALGVGAVGFVTVFTVFFSNWSGADTEFTRWNSVIDGLRGGFEYWRGQQDVGRGGQPGYYYFYVIGAYEWLAVALAGVGVARVIRQPTRFGRLALWGAVASLGAYSWASERMPWLVLHPLVWIVLLAGLGVQQLWEWRRVRLVPALGVLALAGAGWTVAQAVLVAYERGTEPTEMLTQAGQATDDLVAVVDQLSRLDRYAQADLGRPAAIVVDTSDSAAWPYVWYFRDLADVTYQDLATTDPPDGADAVIVVSRNQARVAPLLAGYEATPSSHRSWWVPSYHAGWVRGWAGWLVDRDVWDETEVGSLDETLYLSPEMVDLERRARAQSHS